MRGYKIDGDEKATLKQLHVGTKYVTKEYGIYDFFEDGDIITLTEYEYSLLSNQTIAQSRHELKILKIIDSSRVTGWSVENLNFRTAELNLAILNAAKSIPIFLVVADGHHIVAIGLLSDQSMPGVVNIVYINSAFGVGSERYISSKLTGLDLLCELIRIAGQIDNPIDNTQKLRTQVSHIYFDPTQQLGNNCGVITAFNIASLASYWKKKAGNNLNFSEFGNEVSSLQHSVIISCNNSDLKKQKFVGYVRNKFKALTHLNVDSIPTEIFPIENRTNITVHVKQLNMEQIHEIIKNLSAVNEERAKNSNKIITILSEENSKLLSRSDLKSMVFDIIDRSRGITGENIDIPYTMDELNQACSLLILEQNKLLDIGAKIELMLEAEPNRRVEQSYGKAIDELFKEMTMELTTFPVPASVQPMEHLFNVMQKHAIIFDQNIESSNHLALGERIKKIEQSIKNKNYQTVSVEIKSILENMQVGINKGKYIEEEYKIFLKLAELYSASENIRDCTKSVAIYQYLHKYLRGNNKKSPCYFDIETETADLDKRIGRVEKDFIEKVTKTTLHNEAGTQSLERVRRKKEALDCYRASIKDKLGDNNLESIYKDIREFFIGERDKEKGELKEEKKGIINELIEDCIKELGGLPQVTKGGITRSCQYAIFGMGSMALGTITPWSDIEFGVIIEDGIPDEFVVKEFFRNLTALFHIKVINFEETPLRVMGIEELNNFKITEKYDKKDNWFYDEFTKYGFKFDGPHWHACKTPLGRQKGYKKTVLKVIEKELVPYCSQQFLYPMGDKFCTGGIVRGWVGKKEIPWKWEEEVVPCSEYELILNVSKLAEFCLSEERNNEDPQLTQALKHIVLLHGSSKLLEIYKAKLKSKAEVIQARGFKMLRDDCEKLSPFRSILDDDKEGHWLNVKKEIYRFPDRIVVALVDCLNGMGETNWEALRSLRNEKNIHLIEELLQTLNIATEIRLRTYIKHKEQREDLSVIADYVLQTEANKQRYLEEKIFYLDEIQKLYKHYGILLRLTIQIEEAKTILELNNIFSINISESVEALIKGYTFKRFLRYDDAIKELEKVDYNKYTNEKNTLGHLYILAKRYQDALKLFMSQRLKIIINENENIKDSDPADPTIYFNNISIVYIRMGEYKQALHYLQEWSISYCEKGSLRAGQLSNNIGIILAQLNKPTDALEAFQKSLEILSIKGDSLDKAVLFNNLGNIFLNKGDCLRAVQFFEVSIKERQKIYNGDNRHIALTLYKLGLLLEQKGGDKQAMEYKQRSCDMMQRISNECSVCDSLEDLSSKFSKISIQDSYEEIRLDHHLSYYYNVQVFHHQNVFVFPSQYSSKEQSTDHKDTHDILLSISSYSDIQQKFLKAYGESIKKRGGKKASGESWNFIINMTDQEKRKVVEYCKNEIKCTKDSIEIDEEGKNIYRISLYSKELIEKIHSMYIKLLQDKSYCK